MIFSNLYFLSSCLVSLFYLGGLIFFLGDHKPSDNCEMTYMFEYPQYVKISQEIDKKYPKYGLYAYGEGRITYRARNMDFDGIPVLFIPGNAGSHQQVRSLSSVALRKALNSRTIYHFDYFTVSLNSEYSALYGPVLNEQLEYVTSSLHRVLELYKKNENPPKQVVLVGHSIGGVIARKLLLNLPQESNLVPIVIALASPFKRPLVKFDRYLNDFYKMDSTFHQDTNIISVAGGYSDFLIPTYLTEMNKSNALNVASTNIAKAWVESSHVQIVWCKQTVLAINRALFDVVDPKTKQIYPSKSYRDIVFRHHFVHNSGTKVNFRSTSIEPYQFDYNKGEWSESILKQYSITFAKGLKEPHWYMVGLTGTPGYEMLTVLAVNMDVTNWIFACNAAYPKGTGRVCVSGQHLSHYSEIVPSHFYKRRLISLNLHEIKKNNTQLTHIVFRALPSSKSLSYHVDTYSPHERKQQVTLPEVSLKKLTLISQTPLKAIVYELELENLWNMLQFYLLFVEPLSCSNTQHHAMVSLVTPWTGHDVHQAITEYTKNPLYLRLQSARPRNGPGPKVRLTLDPGCTYKISVQLSISGVFGQIARYYSPLLVTNVAVVILLAFKRQLETLQRTKPCGIFFTALKDSLSLQWVVVAATYFLGAYSQSVPLLNKLLPRGDAYEFPHGGANLVDFFVIPVLLQMISIVLVFLLVCAYSVSLFALESTVHKCTLKFLARSVTFSIQFSDYFMSFLQKVPFLMVAVLIFICLSTCGGLAICVGMVLYFLKLTQMSQDYIEEVIWFVVKSFAKKLKKSFSKRSNSNRNEQKNHRGVGAIENKTNNDDKKALDLKENNTDNAQIKTENSEQNDEKIEQINEPSTSTNDKTPLENEAVTENETTVENKSENDENIINKIKPDFNPIFFHSSLFFIWAIVMVLNVPAVLTWAHNFKYSKVLSPDESFIPGVVLSLCALPLWHLDLPRTDRKYFHELSTIILVLATLSLTYATVSVYRLNYVLTLILALVVLQQLLAPKSSELDSTSRADDEQKNPERKYEEVKKKID